MAMQTLTPEEKELLDMLEGRQPVERDRCNVLVERLMERAWPVLVEYLRRRCGQDYSNAEQLAVDTCVTAYEILQQQMTQTTTTLPASTTMCYSSVHCPQFVGFLKALSKWKPLDEVRKSRRYRALVNSLARRTQHDEIQHGTLRSRSNGARLPLRQVEQLEEDEATLWEVLSQLPCREKLVVQLYFQHGPEPLTAAQLVTMATEAGCTPQIVRPLQRRFRAMLQRQHVSSMSHLTQDTIAALFDVDRETIRRLLGKARQHLQAAWHRAR